MITSLLSNVAVFTNANQNNEFTKSFLDVFANLPESKFTFLALAQKLPPYANFPSPHRKARLEDLLRVAAQSAIDDLTRHAKEIPLTHYEQEILEGRFPKSLLDWIDSSSASLLLKESLDCDGEYGNASKGDIKLTRDSAAPVLLAHSNIQKGHSVMVGIAPNYEDNTNDRFCMRLIETASAIAKVLQGKLYVLNVWDVWGENLIQTRVDSQEIQEMRDHAKEEAQQSVQRILSECDLQGVDYELLVEKGDPTRILSDTIDAKKPGLVVLGSTAKEGLKGALLGNTAETMARKKQSSVLILR